MTFSSLIFFIYEILAIPAFFGQTVIFTCSARMMGWPLDLFRPENGGLTMRTIKVFPAAPALISVEPGLRHEPAYAGMRGGRLSPWGRPLEPLVFLPTGRREKGRSRTVQIPRNMMRVFPGSPEKGRSCPMSSPCPHGDDRSPSTPSGHKTPSASAPQDARMRSGTGARGSGSGMGIERLPTIPAIRCAAPCSCGFHPPWRRGPSRKPSRPQGDLRFFPSKKIVERKGARWRNPASEEEKGLLRHPRPFDPLALRW